MSRRHREVVRNKQHMSLCDVDILRIRFSVINPFTHHTLRTTGLITADCRAGVQSLCTRCSCWQTNRNSGVFVFVKAR